MATRAFREELDKSSRSQTEFSRTTKAMDADARQTSTSINQLTGRLRLAVDAIALLGPAAVPIGAVAIPAVAGLANQLGILAVGAGTAVLAFQGVGEAFKALEKARLDPTVENLAEVQRLMSELEPAARGFVDQIDAMRPAFDSIQDSAAAGLFPGFTEGLADLESMVGPVRRAVGQIATGFGEAAAAEADAFDSERGREFIRFLGTEAPQTLSVLFETVRNLAAGMGELWMTFEEPNEDFADWLLGQSQAFDEWSQRLGQTQGFEDFLAYIATNGPKVADALGAIGNMGVQIVEAVAPLGGPVLEGLEFFADTVATIADSDIGAPLFAAAAAAALLNRGLQLTAGLLTRVSGAQATANAAGAAAAAGGVGMFAGTRAQTASIATSIDGLKAKATSAQGPIKNLGNAIAFAAYSGDTLTKSANSSSVAASTSAKRALEARSAVAGYAGAAAKAGLAVGALGVLSTEAGQGLGVTNTALLGMTGAMAGPWGAAIGTSIGLLLDLSKMGDTAEASMDRLSANVASSGTDFVSLAGNIADGKAEVDGYIGSLSLLERAYEGWDQLLTGESAANTQGDQWAEERDNAEALRDAYIRLAGGMGELNDLGPGGVPSLTELTGIAERAKPALDALGYSMEDLRAMQQAGDLTGLTQIGMEVQAWIKHADSAAGRTEAFAKSVADLGDDALSTAVSAQTFATALEAVLSPGLNAEAGTDAWRVSLQGLQKELVDGAGFEGFTEGAIKNRELTRDYANTSIERLTALAQVSTTTQGEMSRAVAATRREFIRSGVAANLDRKAVVARANAMGLTPKLVRTVFDAAGVKQSEVQARQLRKTYQSLPKRLRTEIKTDGVPKTRADVNDMARRYKGLSRQQVRTLVRLQAEGAKKGITDIDRLLRVLGKRNAQPKVDVDTVKGRNAIQSFSKSLEKTGKMSVEAKISANNAKAMQALQQSNSGLNQYDGRTVTANLDGNASGVSSAVSAARSYLNSIDGDVATTYIRTVRTGARNEDGGFHENGARAFADGGWGQDGRYYSRRSQIVKGGANILWGEESTGWEAYISGKPSMRRRNIDILGIAAQRLGVEILDRRPRAYADGGVTGNGPSMAQLAALSGPRSTTRVNVGLGSLKGLAISGQLQTDASGNAYLVGVVEDVVHDVMARDSEHAHDHMIGARG